ncbi:phage tail protein [Amycolatopsis samaneae]|uniref:Phage tail protein n=1 Tax=Amycolatopsis samaneae TaxID=664691 RepID=A0ABW5GEB7_9PSEU
MAEPARRNDPFPAFNFTLELPIGVAGFSEITGANAEQDLIEYREGADPVNYVSKIPGLNKFGDITLKRGYTDNKALWQWRAQLIDGQVTRYDGAIHLRDETRNVVLTWKFEHALPKKLSAPAFNAKTNEVAIEELVLAVEHMRLDTA